MTDLAHTSVPLWFTGGSSALSGAPDSAVYHLLVGVGGTATPLLQQWQDELDGRAALEILSHEDVDSAGIALSEALGRARVGLRLRLASPAGACLTLRGMALRGGLEDDEIVAIITEPGSIEVFCTHCRTVTSTSAGIGDVVGCTGCQRNLLVYQHVSRLSGRFMGFMVDAEEVITK